MFLSDSRSSFAQKLSRLSWPLVAVVTLTALIGVMLLYSAGGMSWQPWAASQLLRLMLGVGLMLLLGTLNVRFYWDYAYAFYAAVLLLLMIVEMMGHIGMGAQRWLQLGMFVLQPGELMKLALVLALAKYFNDLPSEEIGHPLKLIFPAALAGLPILLILIQPNLGTATLLSLVACTLFFTAGVRWWKFALVLVVLAGAAPIVWDQLHDYQRQRVLTFMDPAADPLGTGYNIAQAKIALGSGGILGKGLGEGTQSQLDFVPEIHTDFIFVVLAEEFGLLGALGLLLLYGALISYGTLLALHCRNHFSRLVCLGLTANLFFAAAVNLAMVSGLIPVVGLPLPLVSYGGTQLVSFLLGFGVILSIGANREQRLHHGS